jgi:hypothetical protein
VEAQVSLPAFFFASQSPAKDDKHNVKRRVRRSRVEGAEELNDPFLATTMTSRGELYREGSSAMIVTIDCEPLPAVSVGTAIFNLRTKFLNLRECVANFFFLYMGWLGLIMMWCGQANLGVLSWDLDLVNLAVLKFSKIVTEDLKRLHMRSGIEKPLVLVAPFLKTS